MSTKDAGPKPPGPWPTLEAYCAKHGDGCEVKDTLEPDVKTVKVTDDEHITTWLALRTAFGWWAESKMLAQDERKTGFTNPTVFFDLTVKRPTKAPPFVLVQREWFQSTPVPSDPEHPNTQRMFVEGGADVSACRFDPGYPDCSERLVLADVHGDARDFAWDGGVPSFPVAIYLVSEEDGHIQKLLP